jgi:alpha-beta hydrolase superfamily lysophospholipase
MPSPRGESVTRGRPDVIEHIQLYVSGRTQIAAYRWDPAAGLTDVTIRTYPDARHEILNETNRDEVIADLKSWLDRVLAS